MSRGWCASLLVLTGCNGLLGNTEHEVARDASIIEPDDAFAPVSSEGGAAPEGSDAAIAIDGSGNVGGGKSDAGVDGASSTDAGGCTVGCPPPSCAADGRGRSDCNGGSCCESPAVPSGSFARSYDGIYSKDDSYPAKISAFRLDRYEVTVGRFRAFVSAVVNGWRPSAGEGKHAHLNGGNGLVVVGGGAETGWSASWLTNLPLTQTDWNTKLTGGTWTPAPGNNENLPISNASWFESYAFCIWDDGFLPSEAEWNYAASGGSEQRVYPWSAAFPPGSTQVSCANAWYHPCTANGETIAVGSRSPAGDGRWGQADLAGNLYEWTLDWQADYTNPCTDCSALTPVPQRGRVMRGGAVGFDVTVAAAPRSQAVPTGHFTDIGVRCARSP